MSSETQHHEISLRTHRRGTYNITEEAQSFLNNLRVQSGILHVFVSHTSASLILCENADPGVRRDLELAFASIAADGDPRFEHTAEGPDDMAAHIRSVLTTNSISIPVIGGELALGTWQGLYLWEHRTRPHHRRVIFSYHP